MSTELQPITNRTQAEIEQSISIKTANLQRILVAVACDIGLDLTDLKAKCPHGEWGSTLKRLGYSHSTANNLIRIYEAYGTSQISLFGGANCQTFGNLEYSKALALLAVPAEEREEFAEAVDVEHVSVRDLKSAIRERDEARNQAKGWELKYQSAQGAVQRAEQADRERENALADLRAKDAALTMANQQLTARNAEMDALRAQLEEAQSREPEVQTVDASEEQIAAAEARGRDSGLSEAADKLLEAELRWRSLNEQLTAERDEANATAESLSKRLDAAEAQASAASASDENGRRLAEINVLFRQMQTDAARIQAILPELDDVTRERVRAALRKVLGQL